MDVHLLVYDLSGGMARQMSPGLLGFQLDAIYHTSIMLNNTEYVYDGGIVATDALGRTKLSLNAIESYLLSLRGVYTAEAYNLWHHNCNNFSNDFATFLVGSGIPDYILNMPQSVIDSPFGNMLLPALNQRVNANRQSGSVLGIGATAQRPTPQTGFPAHRPGQVRTVTSLRELEWVLAGAARSCAVVFFTSATCAPCRSLYPLYDEMAAELGDKVVLIKVDISLAPDVAKRFMIQATPTFFTYLKGERENRWTGANATALRGNMQLLVHMAAPSHPHQSLNLPSFEDPTAKPVLFTRVPPLPKLLAKMGSAADDPAVKGVAEFIETREMMGAAEAHLPHMPAFGNFLRTEFQHLPQEVLFTVVDLLRCAMMDPRFSGYFAEEKDHRTILSLLNYIVGLESCPYALRLITLQMACNLFSSQLYPEHILGNSRLRAPIVLLLSSSFLDDHNTSVRAAAASLLFNLALANSASRRKDQPDLLPAADQIELAAATLEAISQETQSREALHGMLMALGYLVYRLPLDSELADLLRSMNPPTVVMSKRKPPFHDLPLVVEVGTELLGKGLRKP